MNHVRLLVVFAGLACLPGSAVAQEPPDGLALLRGVEQSRLSLKSGRIVFKTEMVRESKISDPQELKMEWEGDRWTADIQKYELFLSPEDSVKYEAMVKKGERPTPDIGTTKKVNLRIAWNGTQLIQTHDISTVAAYIDGSHGNAEVVFDPRIYGLTTLYMNFETLRPMLRLDAIKEVLPVQRDTVGNIPVWHITVIDKYNDRREYWVEDTPAFRVHRVRAIDQNTGDGRETVSFYPDGNNSDILPKEVRTYYYFNHKAASRYRRGEILQAEIGVPVSPDVGTIRSLGLAIGTQVNDNIAKKRLGYWDGTGISPVEIEPAAPPANPAQTTEPGNTWKLPAIIGGSLFLIAILFAIWRRVAGRRGDQNTASVQ